MEGDRSGDFVVLKKGKAENFFAELLGKFIEERRGGLRIGRQGSSGDEEAEILEVSLTAKE